MYNFSVRVTLSGSGSLDMHRLSSVLEQRQKVLRENRYLKGLEENILVYLAKQTHLLAFEQGETIIREGKPCQGLYVVETGRVKIYKISVSGREMIINFMGPGDSFNEVPVFDQDDNPANVEAVLDSQLWLIDAQALRKVIADNPQAAHQIIINLSQNLRMLVGMVAELSFYTVTARLARLLRQLPPEELSGATQNRLTQDDLAAMIGTVREVVARSLRELETSGAIRVEQGKIDILDSAKLRDWE
jgi:CRP-like cAMP-binding protein